MGTYFMFGKYSREAIKGINASRTKQAEDIIEQIGGKIKSIYALLGEYDLVLIVDFPQLQDAMKASLALTRLTNVAFSTSPAVTVSEFDKMIAES